VTVHAALGIVNRVVANGAPIGFHTPSQVVGSDFVSRLPGSTPLKLSDR
jgi:short subunit dehydrogenase-like uncharacterized protein